MLLKINRAALIKDVAGNSLYRKYMNSPEGSKYKKPYTRKEKLYSLDDDEDTLPEDYPFGEDEEYFDLDDDNLDEDYPFGDDEEYFEMDDESSEVSEDDILSDNQLLFPILQSLWDKANTYTPVDTGLLKSSMYLNRYDEGYVLGYDDAVCPYATFVHELSFNRHKPPTQYKFLEDAALEVMSEVLDKYDVLLNIKIEYQPLRVFIGVEDAGDAQSLSLIQVKSGLYLTKESRANQWKFINSIPLTPDDQEKYDNMIKFFVYYRKRGFSNKKVMDAWLWRMRHN